jgi:hypothetical protein
MFVYLGLSQSSASFFYRARTTSLRETSANKSKLQNHSYNLNLNSQIRMKKYMKKRITKPGKENVELPRHRVLAAAAAHPLPTDRLFRCLSRKHKVRKCRDRAALAWERTDDSPLGFTNGSPARPRGRQSRPMPMNQGKKGKETRIDS